MLADARVLLLAPTTSLVAQSLREWTAESAEPFHAFVVCSDAKVGRDEADSAPTTWPIQGHRCQAVKQAAAALSQGRRTVVFSTY